MAKEHEDRIGPATLTNDEFQQQLESLPVDVRQSIEKADPLLRQTMLRMYVKAETFEAEAQKNANEIREAIAPGGQLQPQQMWTPCAPMPTDMCRVSPFFPLRQHDMKERPFVRGMVITSNSWGELRYTGPKLSTYEEDVLLAVLALLDSKKNRHVEVVEGRSAYTYRGPLLPVLRLMGYSDSVGRTNYKRVTDALELMTVAGIRMEIFGHTAKGKRKVKTWDMTNILSHAKWDDEKKELHITVNPYFYEQYIAGTVALIDVVERAKLRSPIAKSLMRFMQSHRAEKWGPGHYLTLARTLNLDLEQPPKQIRRLLKGAIDELLKSGWLSAGGFESKDLVCLTRKAANGRKLLKK